MITADGLNLPVDAMLDTGFTKFMAIRLMNIQLLLLEMTNLLRREDVVYLVKGVTQSKAVFEVLSVAFRLLLGQEIGYEHPYGWLRVFDADELQDFIKEVSEAFRLTDTSNQAWDLIDAIIYEWKESSIAILSPELAAAFNDETDEIPLTSPINKSGS
ncbi:hypothetical protein [Dolichospermum compactum]|uniref:Uncharacterized protein n=1 Tax=Dolichospermum compactum NIES-806 TaxID=1973481 RepID=A0A1Z4V089_9CYAN|nr:hypothetical protein [Dolichospermum compactum]BAZ84779.1 hypothetical protein NIES806_09710 [Dolichospermum compactum NIES-806]